MNEWALVTGASSGIGRAIAVKLAGTGMNVIVNHFHDPDGAAETLEMVRKAGSDGVAIGADVGNAAEVSAMFSQISELDAPLRLLVNNAGVQTWASFLELKESDFDRTIRTNLKGTFLCTQAAAKLMIQQGGRSSNAEIRSPGESQYSIVNIGSGANRVPFPNLSDYCASKGGIEMLTKCAATELGPYGIRVNCVAPGAIENERTQAENPEYAKTWSALTPLRRCGNQEDVAKAVAYLAAPESEFISGQTIYVDGGLWTRNQWPYE